MQPLIDTLMLDVYLRIISTNDISIVGQEAWEKINEEILAYTGLSDKQIYMLEKQRELALLMVEIVANDNTELLTQFNIESKKLEELKNIEEKETDIYYFIAILEKFLTFQINKKETSVRQWLAYTKLLNENGRKSDKE